MRRAIYTSVGSLLPDGADLDFDFEPGEDKGDDLHHRARGIAVGEHLGEDGLDGFAVANVGEVLGDVEWEIR